MKKFILIAFICIISTGVRSQSWNITGNTGTNGTTNFIGTTDNVAFKIRTKNAVRITVTGGGKIGIGITSPVFKLDVKGGSINTDSLYRIGGKTMLSAQGVENIFVGAGCGISNTTGSDNTANGFNALGYNTQGSFNTAIGVQALYYNTTGTCNTANGMYALFSNTTGQNNTANGMWSLYYNTTGYNNTGNGINALTSNTTGNGNTGNGYTALYANTTGILNTSLGTSALSYITTGSYNTAVGANAGTYNGLNPSNYMALGYMSGIVANSNEVHIGNTNVTWIGGQQGWSTYSDKRIKDNIQNNVPGLAFITKLNPVTYKLNIHKQNEMCGIKDTNEWEGKYDIEKITQTGFLAQEVEQAALECNYDFNGVNAPHGNTTLYSLQYASFVVPLVKAVQELNDELKKQNAELLKRIENLENKNEIENKSENAPPNNTGLLLEQNSPNPFSEKTIIRYAVPAFAQQAKIIILSPEGKELMTFNISGGGSGQIEISGGQLAAGIYNYALFIDGKASVSKQMILTK